jgi:hypothetical protein
MTVQVVNLSGGGIGIFDDADLIMEQSWITIYGDRAAEREIEMEVIRNQKFTMPKGTLTRIDAEDFELVDEQGRKLTIHAPNRDIAARLEHQNTHHQLNSNQTVPPTDKRVLVWNAPFQHQFGPIEE